MKTKTYEGASAKEISFPIGGIGSGCIGLGGNGRLIDWEIFNRPNKGSVNGFSHFAVKAERDGLVLGARVLQGDLQPSYMGNFGKPMFASFGFGPPRETLAGVPHFRDVTFEGSYPFAKLSFSDPQFPGKAGLSAWNPLIPLNEDDSSLPSAFFEVTLENTDTAPIEYTVAFSAANPLTRGALLNTTEIRDGVRYLHLRSDDADRGNPAYGDLCVATDASDTGFQNYWYRGRWFDSLGVFWRDFTAPGKLRNRTYQPDPAARSDTGTLTAHLKLAPGQTGTVRFLLSWNFPNNTNYWNPVPESKKEAVGDAGADAAACSCDSGCGETGGCCDPAGHPAGTWKNWYATKFEHSFATSRYAMANWNRLYCETRQFHDALFSSTLPDSVLDAVSANISILKSPTCLRLEDGSFYGWEGCGCDSGCCEGSCTHVWNYAYALPFLFPKLERSMRDLDFRHNMREDGGMVFRMQLPVGRERGVFRPCADGQFGGVLKAYRDWKISGDTEWLKGHWEAIKKNIAFAWSPTNEDGWDADKDGVLEGRQHHTLDMELFGPNSWLTGFYLGALKAAGEMADFLGDKPAAAEFSGLFIKGKAWADTHLFNGEYYMQKIDLKDKRLLERYDSGTSLFGDSTLSAYWNEEALEIKYQIGEGSAIDQVLAQWHANLSGLGEIYRPDQVKKALGAIYKYNYKRSFRDFFNPCRLYSMNDEGGVVICDWPEGVYKPVVPTPYCEETMYGFEYQAAIHMIQEGMVEEGLEIVRVIRSRFDGEKRNPWNEFECGSNYARSMASYALLNALSGFSYDMVKGRIGFKPVISGYRETDETESVLVGQMRMEKDSQPHSAQSGQMQLNRTERAHMEPYGKMLPADEAFQCFWSLDAGWGTYRQGLYGAELHLAVGTLPLRELELDKAAFDRAAGTIPQNHPGSAVPFAGMRALSLDCRSENGTRFVSANIRDGVVELEDGFTLQAGETLAVPFV
jgi:non-lysosomal glucosylceramidase